MPRLPAPNAAAVPPNAWFRVSLPPAKAAPLPRRTAATARAAAGALAVLAALTTISRMKNLQNKLALVTGGSSGIGLALSNSWLNAEPMFGSQPAVQMF